MALDRAKVGLGLGAVLIGATSLFTSIRLAVPRHVDVNGRVVIDIDGLSDLKPLPRRITINLPEGFTLNAPTDFRVRGRAKAEVGGKVVVEEKRSP